MNREEVLRLAKLARIDIKDDEAEKLSHEFQAILNYVDEIKSAKINIDNDYIDSPTKNTMREDTNPHESGLYTEALLREAPETKDGFVRVKKIL